MWLLYRGFLVLPGSLAKSYVALVWGIVVDEFWEPAP
jgi:hypothetical protein